MNLSHKQLAYALLRIYFGLNFLGHGLFRMLSGVGGFAQTTTEHLSKSPLPHALTLHFSYAIPVLEALLGLGLILGLFTRLALVLGAVFMMALTVGITSNQQWDVAGQQLLYAVVFFLLLFYAEHDALAVDSLLYGRGINPGV